MQRLLDQLEFTRRELSRLLTLCQQASPDQREWITERCDSLGGDVQELVGLLKLALFRVRQEAADEHSTNPHAAAKKETMATAALQAVDQASDEIGKAIRVLRTFATPPEGPTDQP